MRVRAYKTGVAVDEEVCCRGFVLDELSKFRKLSDFVIIKLADDDNATSCYSIVRK